MILLCKNCGHELYPINDELFHGFSMSEKIQKTKEGDLEITSIRTYHRLCIFYPAPDRINCCLCNKPESEK